MARVDLKSLFDRLNPACHKALEEAASICVSHGHRDVSVEHLLLGLAREPGADVRILLQAHSIDPDQLCTRIQASLERFRQGEGNPPVFSPLLVDLLEDAWMVSSIDLGQTEIRGGAVLLALATDLGRFARFEYAIALDSLPVEAIRRGFHELVKGSVETRSSGESAAGGAAHGRRSGGDSGDSALAKYAQCFTEEARNGRIDPVFCRDAEIHQMIDILTRRRKNNPICVGEAGVGKTAVVEGLALKIVTGDVPGSLLGSELYGLDLGALQAGASVKGEFEKRLKGVLDEIKSADRPVILFIDEAHTLIGAGGQAGGSDAANLLKPALARGEIKTIAATTWSEYKKYFEKDPALTRRFQLVKLDEPTVDEACTILRGLVPSYEAAHDGVYISDEGVRAAVELSARYITGRQLPDKAIDVLDTACARVRANANSLPLSIDRIHRAIQSAGREKAILERDLEAGHDAESLEARLEDVEDRLAALADDLVRLENDHRHQKELADSLRALRDRTSGPQDETERRTEIVGLRRAFEEARRGQPLASLEVGPLEVAGIISDWTGVPVSSMRQDELTSLLTLAETMGTTIKGQDHVLKLLEEQLQAARLDLHRAGRPLGVFLLVGPSGVGKTETALEMARRLFGGEQFVTTVNMTEFQEKHTVSRLIGSPPGYVGYGEGGVLTEAIRKKPYSVVLLDEVEKADADVLNLFYQAFDKGMLSDGEGREIDCKNVVFFLASNLASEQIQHFAALETPMTPDEILTEITPVLSNHFKPALLARMQPIVFLPLSRDVMRCIVTSRLEELSALTLEKQGLALEFSPATVERLQSLCMESQTGARLIDQIIARRILPEISRRILRSRLEDTPLGAATVDVDDAGAFVFSFADPPAECEVAAQ